MKPVESPTKQVIKQVKEAMGCLTGDLRTILHASTFTVKDGSDTFTVTVERT